MSRGKQNRSRKRNRKPYSLDDRNKQVNNNLTFNKQINIIADTGASEHIIGKGFILKNFEKCASGIIKSANRDVHADMKIDRNGNPLVTDKTGKVMEITNVLVAKDIAGNLPSLRKFVDLGFCIHLDNKKLRVFDKTTKVNYITGKYVKPNWLISFQTRERKNSQRYKCTAKMIFIEDFMNQPQTDV